MEFAGLAVGDSNPSLVAVSGTFLILAILRVSLLRLSSRRECKGVDMKGSHRRVGIISVIETFWAVGVSYLAAKLLARAQSI